MRARDFDSLLDPVEQLLLRSELAASRQALLTLLRQGRFDREDLSRFCQLLRRSGLWQQSLRLLNPKIRPRSRTRKEPRDAEKVEYAAALIRAGASQEAAALLEQVTSAEQVRSKYLFTSFCSISQWDYASALLTLQKLVARKDLTGYDRLVAEANLASALVYERHHDEAVKLLARIVPQCEAGQYWLLLASVLELRAQNEFSLGRFDAASRQLDQAEVSVKGVERINDFFIRKWRAFIAMRMLGSESQWAPVLQTIRDEARQRKHWETLRACDLQQALVTQDRTLIQKIYLGTPYSAYRHTLKDLAKHFAPELGKDQEFEIAFQGDVFLPPTAASKAFSVSTGVNDFSTKRLKTGQLLQRALSALCLDFYRPFTLGELHARLFPKAYFNPVSSPDKVHQALKRLRAWLHSARVPLSVRYDDGFYSLTSTGQSSVLLKIAAPGGSQVLPLGSQNFLARLRRNFADGDFNAETAARRLRMPRRTVAFHLGLLNKACVVERSGAGPLTRYQINSDVGG